jgi:serine protease Do
MERFMLNTPDNDLPKGSDSSQLFRRRVAARARYGVSALAILALLGLEAYQLRNAAATPDHSQARIQAQPDMLPSFSGLVERVAPAVVSIRVKANPAAITALDEEDDEQSTEKSNPFDGTPLERFFPSPSKMPSQRPRNNQEKGAGPLEPIQGQGSGFFISADGYIVTNHHVVEGALKVDVVTDTGQILEAKVIGSDPGTDLALIKVEGSEPFPTVKLGRTEPKVGDWVIALGNPFGLEGTVTAGIVSARGRDIGLGSYDNFIQIDAPVNKGNSGGPSFNQAGEVIGVNTAIFSPSGGSVGIAFAIPAKSVESIIAQLKEKGHVTRGWLGVQVQAVTPELADSLGLKEARGALVSLPAPGSPAEAAGIKRGDVIVKIDEDVVKDSRDLARKIASLAPETQVKIAVFRDDRRQIIGVKLAELQDEAKPQLPRSGSSSQTEMGSLGISVAPAGDGKSEAPNGLTVLEIKPDGRGADAGLIQGDIILTANGADVSSPAALEAALKSARAGGKKHALSLVQRSGTQVYVALPADLG